MSNPQAQGSQPQQPQQNVQLLKADDLPKLQSLSDDLRQKYRPVLQNFWALMQAKPLASPEHQQARAKLQEWSSKLIAQERQWRAKNRQQNPGQPPQQQPPGQLGQPGQSSQQPQQAQPNQQSQQPQQPVKVEQPAPAQPPQPQPQPQPQAQPQPNQQANQGQQQQQQQQQQGARPAGQQNTQQQINPEIIRHVQNFTYHLPPQGPQAGTPDGDHKLKELRNSYLMALNKQEKSTHRVKAYQNMIEQRNKGGQDVPPELLSQKTQAEQEYANAKRYVEEFRRRQAQWKQEHEQRKMSQSGQGGPGPQQQPPPPGPPQAQPQQPQQPQQTLKQEPQVKVEQQQMHPLPGSVQQQQPNVQAPSVTQNQQPVRPPPAPHSQSMPQPNQFAQPGQPHAQQPPRPQINPAQANAHAHAQQQTNSPHPQSAASATGQPVPLTHQAAVNAAQRSYSNTEPQRTSTPLQGHGGNFHPPGSREREQLNNPKMPIPRTLNVTTPQPVSMGQARPTMSGPTNGAPGPMGQPVINKFPQFQLEGEGDRVLSKRKLDELVRQVTGGSEDQLTPEVEEAVLQLADDFVDTVISSACKLSKLRESPSLDIRDIQLVLERNYNIRIPGYASDEIRTVRKLVPAPGWTQKMNAVQAAKVMGGKTDI
ncbi:transcription initiation factor TFIID subunit A-domain-containing protein [Lophiotrema nucula]|uniref:Transcription initiation factor TFIID subunit A-domain-containing protein n=1 Tax=Lophiotrema nucula TaxID=690887 RepID=A0A6A5Z8T1_9PLEO|nr:transcription initiation factor TFIID subunit A-domain-containing protein [Lophiotrema nucula]